MMGFLMLAAAANAPMQFASRDDARWRLFVDTSLQRPAGAQGTRLRQLEGVVRRLGAERRELQVAGPSGL